MGDEGERRALPKGSTRQLREAEAAERLKQGLAAADYQGARWATVEPDDLRLVLESRRVQHGPRQQQAYRPKRFFASRQFVAGFLSGLVALGLVVLLVALAD